MDRPPRPSTEGVLTVSTWVIIVVQGLIQSVATLSVYLLSQSGFYPGIDSQDLEKQRSLAFCTLTTMQIAQSFLSRSVILSIFTTGLLGNRWLLGAAMFSFSSLILGLYLPGLSHWLELQGPRNEWWAVAVCVVIQFVMVELLKMGMRWNNARILKQTKS